MINLSEPFIRRPVMTLLVMTSILFFGFLSYRSLPVNDLPSVDFPVISVVTSNPGASPETMANTVATPLEKEFMSISGLTAMTSNSITGTTTNILQFALDKPLDSAALDVEAAINRAQPNLPTDLPYNPTYNKVNPADTPIIYYAVTSPSIQVSKLHDYASTLIGQRISMIQGVSQVMTYGSPYAARIQVNPEKLAALNIGIDEVANAIQTGNVDLPVGTLYGAKDEFTIDVDGQLFNADQYNELVIKTENNAIVKVKNIGNALDSQKDDKYYLKYLEKGKSPKPCIVIAVQKQVGGNAVKIVESIEKLLPNLQKEIPSSIAFHKIYDKAEGIKASVFDVEMTLITAFILVVFIIFISLGKLTDTVIPSLSLPLAIMGTFGAMLLVGFSLNILSLLALTLSIGFLVDDAIVVLENNVRHVEMGKNPFTGTIEGSKQISFTILSMSLCLMAVFIPMIFLGGIVGKLFREFSLTIIIAVALSGFISLTFTPLLCSRFIRVRKKDQKKRFMERVADRLNTFLLNLYKKTLTFVMKAKLVMVFIGTACIALSLYLVVILPKDFLPITDMGFLQGFSEAQDGTSPYQMANYQEEISNVLQENPYVERAISVASTSTDNEGMMFISLVDHKHRPGIEAVSKQLMNDLFLLPGFNAYISPIPLINLQLGTQTKALYQFAMSAVDQDTLNKTAYEMLNKVRSIPGFTQVSSDLQIAQPQLEMNILRDRASDLNVTANKVETALQFAFSGGKVSMINSSIAQYDVIIETLPEYYKNPSVVNYLYLRSQTNKLVPLSQVVNIRESVGPLTVNHYNGIPSATLSFNLEKNTSLSQAQSLLDKVAEETLPPTVSGEMQGTMDVFAKSFASLSFLFIIMIFVVYVILGILYENFVHPLTVMSALPPATFGGLLTLYLFNENLSLVSFLGLIMLLGIVMKNGVILVDFAIHLIKNENKNPQEAIIEACYIRFRPIMMTTMAAFMGALPIALALAGPASLGNRPLGLVVCGGLIISQVLTLLLTPVTFYYLEKIREKVLNLKKAL